MKTTLIVHRDYERFVKKDFLRWDGTTASLNALVGKAETDVVLLLAAKPAAGWRAALEKALDEADLVVGETSSALPGGPTPHGKLALKLFHGHSRRAAEAKGHALPWGPYYNLGFRRELVGRVGPFSTVAEGAFDIDFCWRAVLDGARIAYAPKATAARERANSREALLREFDGYGQGEAWLHRAYAFLLDGEKQDPLLASVDAFTRLRHHSQASKAKALAAPLDETAAAFASGVRAGMGGWKRECELPRRNPREAISWRSGPKEETVFVAGKGVTQFHGPMLGVWRAMRAGTGEETLVKLVRKAFRASGDEAAHLLADIRAALAPERSGL